MTRTVRLLALSWQPATRSAAVLLAMLAAPLPLAAGDASGLDPAIIEECLIAAATDGQRLDCAGSGVKACLDYAATEHPDVHPIDRELNCTDAEWQVWDEKLGQTYDALKAVETERGAERADALVQMERDWITFRDARCVYDKITNGRGTGGALAEPACKLNETARQVILLMSYQRDRT